MLLIKKIKKIAVVISKMVNRELLVGLGFGFE